MMKNIPAKKDHVAYVAFLRGINVGGNTLIKMEDLRKSFESNGYRNVKTVLASGNVIFEAPEENAAALSQDITRMLLKAFGREILAIVRSIDELRAIEARQPFKDMEAIPGTRLFITFISENMEGKNISIPAKHDGFLIMEVSGGTVCSVLEDGAGVGAVPMMSAIEKEFGRQVTTRSWKTIVRILKVAGR